MYVLSRCTLLDSFAIVETGANICVLFMCQSFLHWKVCANVVLGGVSKQSIWLDVSRSLGRFRLIRSSEEGRGFRPRRRRRLSFVFVATTTSWACVPVYVRACMCACACVCVCVCVCM